MSFRLLTDATVAHYLAFMLVGGLLGLLPLLVVRLGKSECAEAEILDVHLAELRLLLTLHLLDDAHDALAANVSDRVQRRAIPEFPLLRSTRRNLTISSNNEN